MSSAVELFAGPGGWDVSAHELGVRVHGIEIDDRFAAATRRAAGWSTTVGDVRRFRPHAADGLIASPPCRTFSSIGSRRGVASMDAVLQAVRDMHAGRPIDHGLDPTSALVLEPLRWILGVDRPYRWIALEQVPAVLPVWELYSKALRRRGYSTAVGRMYSEQYGAPTTRIRAVLLASLDREVRLPRPTHSRFHRGDPGRLDRGVLPWVSIADVLPERTGQWLTSPNSFKIRRKTGQPPRMRGRAWHQPAWTIATGNGWYYYFTWASEEQLLRLERSDEYFTRREAGLLQGFPEDYPWAAPKEKGSYQQIGDTVPPPMSRALLEEVI